MIKHGPVDVLVLASTEARFDGSMLSELKKQAAAGTIRVLDAMILVKDKSGVRKTIDIEDLPAEETAKLGFIETSTRGVFDSFDSSAMYRDMAPGSALVALAIEQAWAVPLVNLIADKGITIASYSRMSATNADETFAGIETPPEADPAETSSSEVGPETIPPEPIG